MLRVKQGGIKYYFGMTRPGIIEAIVEQIVLERWQVFCDGHLLLHHINISIFLLQKPFQKWLQICKQW